jgi:hypothetical protein
VTVSEVLSGSGSWSVKLKADTPGQVRDAVDWVRTPAAAFGHVLIFNTRVDARAFPSARLYTASRYIGVLLEWRDRLTIAGEGGAWWLGDVITTAITRTNGTITQWVTDLAPASLLAAAAVNPSAATVTGTYQWVTRREALEAVCDAFGLEWHVTARMGLLVGAPVDVWPGDPTTVILPRHEGREGELRTIDAAGVDRSQDLREWANAAYVLGPSGVASATVASGLLDINGNAVTRGVVVQASAGIPGAEATVAGNERALRQQTRRHVKLSSKGYDISADVVTGATVWVFDPDQGLVDRTNQVLAAGQPLRPLAMRVMAQTWPVQEGMGVWFRAGDGTLTDLSDWVEWDTGAASVELGAIARTTKNPAGMIGSAESGDLQAQIGLAGWLPWTPALTASTTSPTLGSGAVTEGRWRRVENLVVGDGRITFGTAGVAAGTGTYRVSLPAPAKVTGASAGPIGNGWLFDSSGNVMKQCTLRAFPGASIAELYFDGTTNWFATAAAPWTWAASDDIRFSLSYEGAF